MLFNYIYVLVDVTYYGCWPYWQSTESAQKEALTSQTQNSDLKGVRKRLTLISVKAAILMALHPWHCRCPGLVKLVNSMPVRPGNSFNSRGLVNWLGHLAFLSPEKNFQVFSFYIDEFCGLCFDRKYPEKSDWTAEPSYSNSKWQPNVLSQSELGIFCPF